MRSILLCALIIATGVVMLRAQDSASVPAADGFQCPVGPNGTGEGYYIARSFRSNGHLGDDWNGIHGGDTDYGDPVYAAAHGVIVFAKNYHVGWGNVVIIRHAYHEGLSLRYVDSLYGHLADFNVREGQIVRRGQLIGHIGSNNGMYDAHLHFEIRKNINIGMYRSSFPRDGTNYYIPNQFIAAHLTCSGGGKTVSVPVNTFPATAPPSYAAAKVYTPVYSPGSAPASHLPPAGVGGLRTLRTSEPPPTPKVVVTAPPATPKPTAPPAPVVETPTTASTSKKETLAPVASKGSPVASSEKKDSTSDKKDSKKESTSASSSKTSSKTSKTAATKTSDESPPKESGHKEPEKKEPEKKESATASTKKSATPAPSGKNAATASAKPTSTPAKSTTAASKPSPTPAPKEPTVAKTTPSEPTPARPAKADPKPSILDPAPLPPAITEGSPIRRSNPGFRVDRFQDLRGMGY